MHRHVLWIRRIPRDVSTSILVHYLQEFEASQHQCFREVWFSLSGECGVCCEAARQCIKHESECVLDMLSGPGDARAPKALAAELCHAFSLLGKQALCCLSCRKSKLRFICWPCSSDSLDATVTRMQKQHRHADQLPNISAQRQSTRNGRQAVENVPACIWQTVIDLCSQEWYTYVNRNDDCETPDR